RRAGIRDVYQMKEVWNDDLRVLRINRVQYLFFVSLPLYLFDPLTKYWVLHTIDPEHPQVVIPNFFHLVNITNTGAAFGSFKDNNALFIGISCVALLFALILLLGSHRDLENPAPSLWLTRNFSRDL